MRLGTGNWTVEGWFYQTADNTYPTALEIGNHLAGGILFVTRYIDTGYSGATTYFATQGFGGTMPTTLNAWNHIAWVRNGNSIQIFVNGIGNGGSAFNFNITDYGPVTIGTNQNINDGYAYTGYIDELRVTVGYARYTANFTPPTSAFLNLGPN
jgi:hypothetical protein